VQVYATKIFKNNEKIEKIKKYTPPKPKNPHIPQIALLVNMRRENAGYHRLIQTATFNRLMDKVYI
jgi:hypothetical protein